MNLTKLEQICRMLGAKIPVDEQYVCAEHDTIHLGPPDESLLVQFKEDGTWPKLEELGVHYNESEGFFCFAS